MSDFHQQLQELQTLHANATIRIETLGNFCVCGEISIKLTPKNGQEIKPSNCCSI